MLILNLNRKLIKNAIDCQKYGSSIQQIRNYLSLEKRPSLNSCHKKQILFSREKLSKIVYLTQTCFESNLPSENASHLISDVASNTPGVLANETYKLGFIADSPITR